MKLGDLIKAYRHENQVTMQEFASRASLSKGYVSMLERNQHPQSQRPLTPSFETYQKVAGAMGITLDELISVLDGDERVKLTYNTSFELCATEQSLIDSFRQLNPEGQEKAVEYVNDLVATGRYIKSDPDGMVEAACGGSVKVDPGAKYLDDDSPRKKLFVKGDLRYENK